MCNSIMLINRDLCCGCLGCYGICERNAISIRRNSDGFDYPEVNQDICVDCGKCLSVCPIHEKKEMCFDYKVAYAMQAEDDLRQKSSSGGAFGVIAEHILNHGGVVCGAAFVNNNVQHIIIEKIEDLQLLQKSKYVQSDMRDIYSSIKSYLKQGTKVLFSGTACQCDAVKKFCENYEELLTTIDVLCMGVPSPGLFDRLKEELEPEISGIDFRDKSIDGWTQNLMFSYVKKGTKICTEGKCMSYYCAFLDGYSLRESCYFCQYPGKKRISDITLGDFWGISEFDEALDDLQGTSLVIVTSAKGRKLINSIAGKCRVLKKIPIEYAIKNNPIISYPTLNRGRRKEFFELVKENSLRYSVDKMEKMEADCGIINFWWADDNGAILTAFALQKALEKMNYSSRLIDFKKDLKPGGISEDFARKYLKVTKQVRSESDLTILNNSFENFLVGSDQVFRAEWVPDSWFLDFVNFKKNKIAVAASFGKDRLDISKERQKKIRFLLSRFNSISVRELQGVEICKSLGAKACQIIDPVFYLKNQEYVDYLGLTMQGERNVDLFVYFRDMDEYIKGICEIIAERHNWKVFWADDSTQVELFLNMLRKSEMVITDSYHGLCFSLIFNKKYVCIENPVRGLERLNSLIEVLALNRKNFVRKEKLSDLCYSDDCGAIEENWNDINERIMSESYKAQEWLKSALEKNNKHYLRMFNGFIKHRGYLITHKVWNNILNRLLFAYFLIKKEKSDENVILFGAGAYALEALNIYRPNVLFFIDNSKKKRWIDDYPVFLLSEANRILSKDAHIVISTSEKYHAEIKIQLIENGYRNIDFFNN